jgi:hypothetical protein
VRFRGFTFGSVLTHGGAIFRRSPRPRPIWSIGQIWPNQRIWPRPSALAS